MNVLLKNMGKWEWEKWEFIALMLHTIKYVYPIAYIMNTNLHVPNYTYHLYLYECFTLKNR